MKKTVKILIMMIVSIVLVVTMTSCSLLFSIILGLEDSMNNDNSNNSVGNVDPDECSHLSWHFAGSAHVQCNADGYVDMKCPACNYVMRVVVPAQHIGLEYVEAVEPSCLPGNTAGEYCMWCQSWVTATELAPICEHKFAAFQNVVVDCFEWCSSNGQEHRHSVMIAQKLTCTQDELLVDDCLICKGQYIIATEPATGHNYVEGVCINEHYYLGIFTPCGQLEAEETIPTVPTCEHSNTEKGEARAPTCSGNGSTDIVWCIDCGTLLEGELIPATGEHVYVNGICTAGCNASVPCKHEHIGEPLEGIYWSALTGWAERLYCYDCNFFVHTKHIEDSDYLGHCDVCGLHCNHVDGVYDELWCPKLGLLPGYCDVCGMPMDE